MNYYTILSDRLDYLIKVKHERILDYQRAILKGRYGHAQVLAEEILNIKSNIRATQDIIYYMFNEIEDQNYLIH